MGNCCGRDAKEDRINKKPMDGKGQRLGGSIENIDMQPLAEKVSKPEPAVNRNINVNRQKVLEATEKRLQEANNRGTKNGGGKLSQKLQEEKTKTLSDYAKEEYEQKQMDDNMKWRAD